MQTKETYPEINRPVIVQIHQPKQAWYDEGIHYVEEMSYQTVGIWRGDYWDIAEYMDDLVWDRIYPADEKNVISWREM